jgi:digeranylgeranylglycerophospholipid reductase
MKNADIVIAGAGVAGCIAARDLAAKGHSVLVLEKNKTAGLGHDWWDSVEVSAFKEANFPLPQPPELMKSFKFDVRSPVGDTGMKAVMPASAVNIDRKPFAKRLLAAAGNAGAKIVERTEIIGPVMEDGILKGVTARHAGGKTATYKASICIDATGSAGAIRTKMPAGYGFDPDISRSSFVVTYREIRPNTRPGGSSPLVIGAHGGAIWLSRDQGDNVDAFACVLDRSGRPDPKEVLYRFIHREGGVGKEILRGGYYERIPVRRGFDSFVAPGFMLIGDSACMANPLNGSGISASMRAASFAAKTAHRALVQGNSGIAALWPYNTAYKRSQDMKFAKLHLMQKFLFAEPEQNLHRLLCMNIMPPDSLWNSEDQLDASKGLEKLPKILPLLDDPSFLARLAYVFILIGALEKHYLSYPETYEPDKFKAWQKQTRKLFNSILKV